jgi:hypothetical protein
MRIEDVGYERREVVGAGKNVIRTLILLFSFVAALRGCLVSSTRQYYGAQLSERRENLNKKRKRGPKRAREPEDGRSDARTRKFVPTSHRATGKLRDFYEFITVVGCVYVFSLPFAQTKTLGKLFVSRDASRRADTIADDEVGSLDSTVFWSIFLPSILSFRWTNRITVKKTIIQDVVRYVKEQIFPYAPTAELSMIALAGGFSERETG